MPWPRTGADGVGRGSRSHGRQLVWQHTAAHWLAVLLHMLQLLSLWLGWLHQHWLARAVPCRADGGRTGADGGGRGRTGLEKPPAAAGLAAHSCSLAGSAAAHVAAAVTLAGSPRPRSRRSSERMTTLASTTVKRDIERAKHVVLSEIDKRDSSYSIKKPFTVKVAGVEGCWFLMYNKPTLAIQAHSQGHVLCCERVVSIDKLCEHMLKHYLFKIRSAQGGADGGGSPGGGGGGGEGEGEGEGEDEDEGGGDGDDGEEAGASLAAPVEAAVGVAVEHAEGNDAEGDDDEGDDEDGVEDGVEDEDADDGSDDDGSDQGSDNSVASEKETGEKKQKKQEKKDHASPDEEVTGTGPHGTVLVSDRIAHALQKYGKPMSREKLIAAVRLLGTAKPDSYLGRVRARVVCARSRARARSRNVNRPYASTSGVPRESRWQGGKTSLENPRQCAQPAVHLLAFLFQQET